MPNEQNAQTRVKGSFSRCCARLAMCR